MMADKGIDWAAVIRPLKANWGVKPLTGEAIVNASRIELEGKYNRGRGSVDEYLEQTAIANPHVTLHYQDPEGKTCSYHRSTSKSLGLAEILPHPYGVEMGRLVTMLKDTECSTITNFLTDSFSRVRASTLFAKGEDQHASPLQADWSAGSRRPLLSGHSDDEDWGSLDGLHLSDWGRARF
ncbi:MAG: hypothetical protein U0894_13165 [Pirellulales bacterium]